MLNIFFSRLLGAAGSGEFYYTINNFAVIALLAGLCLESGITYFLSRREIDDKELIMLSVIWSLVAGVLIFILFFLKGSNFLFSQYSSPFYSFCFITGTLFTTYVSGLFFGRKQFFYPHLIPAIVNVILLLFYGILFIVQKQKNTRLVVTVYFLSFIVNGVVLGILYQVKYASRFSVQWPSFTMLLKLLRYSTLAMVTNIVAFLAYRVDYWILKGFTSRSISEIELGNYIQVSKLMQLFLFVPTIMATVVFPTSASATKPQFNKEFKKMTLRVLLLNSIGCGILLLAGNWFFSVFYGKDFSLMYLCFVFSMPAILAITVVRVIASYFAGVNKIRYNLVGCLIALTGVVAFNFLLIPIMGINGSALADSIGYIAYLFTLLYFLKKEFHKNEKHRVAN